MLLELFVVLYSLVTVSGLGSQCTAPLGGGTAAAGDPYWQQTIAHQGTSAFGPGGYQAFRNVKDFGAKGDGVTDDTAAINAAISSGGRCGSGCGASIRTTPATVFFPQGRAHPYAWTYLVSTPVIAYYYTELVGDAKRPPTIRANSNFAGIAVIDANPYGSGGDNWYVNQNNFYRSVRNFVIDLTQVPASASATGFHWQVSQATSLYNIVVNMATSSGNNHQGMFMENGSGGFMGDLVFNGGKFGIWVGNQQFTVRNITVNNANTAIYGLWNWGWTFQGVTINNCQVGFDLSTGSPTGSPQGVEGEAIIDAVITNTPIFVRSSASSNGKLDGSLVLNNIKLNNVPTAVGIVGGATVLAGGTTTINSWAQGNTYTGTTAGGRYLQGNINNIPKASSLLDSSGRIFGKTRPTYANYAASQFVSVKSQGARGDGNTDDTAALQAVFNNYAGCKIIYFDSGTYIVSSTLTIPAGSQVVGEAWAAIMGSGSNFSNQNSPQVVIRVGTSGSSGVAEISGLLFTTRAPANGAIVVEWNVHDPSGQPGAAGMWDTLLRLGGAAGTNIQSGQCAYTNTNTGNNCYAAFLGLHITSGASAYLEGTWVWLADHDVDGGGGQITAYSGRGILSESQGPVWMIGTGKILHHVLYQYNIAGASNHYMGLIQTETPYFQPNPAPPNPFSSTTAYHDPTIGGKQAAWALNVQSSSNILVYGAGLYSFFQNYATACVNSTSCQSQIINIDSTSSVSIYSLSTVGTQYQISVNGNGVVSSSANANGFAQTLTSWTRS
ncbi:glycoside hydrolase family 55 protein [Auriscalpium vulgare]|uniref:Glycoside hydrolase family 55 protein n=1 Tax=Auriscalpium vulgare TaxID=40419 RepID=A0ACB8S6X3_9AGAM|nr:glycoside hydrolase family 55 protein [Auriscalpium vulgare]